MSTASLQAFTMAFDMNSLVRQLRVVSVSLILVPNIMLQDFNLLVRNLSCNNQAILLHSKYEEDIDGDHYRRQLCAVRSHDSSGEEPSSSGRACSDLLIVGPGVLGSLIGKLWTERQNHAAVVGQTNTETNHDRCHLIMVCSQLLQKTHLPFTNKPYLHNI